MKQIMVINVLPFKQLLTEIHKQLLYNDMHLTEKIKEDVAIISVKGDLVDEDDDAVMQQKIRSLATDDIRKVVLDLGMVHRINSKGLSILVSSLQILQRFGGDIRLARIDKHISDILAITNLVRVFGTYETVERAFASYA